MHDVKAVSLAILMSDASGGPTANGIDDVGWAFDGTEAIAQTVPEGVDDTSSRHPWLQPFVQCRTCRVRIALGFAALFGEGEGWSRSPVSYVLPIVKLPPMAPV